MRNSFIHASYCRSVLYFGGARIYLFWFITLAIGMNACHFQHTKFRAKVCTLAQAKKMAYHERFIIDKIYRWKLLLWDWERHDSRLLLHNTAIKMAMLLHYAILTLISAWYTQQRFLSLLILGAIYCAPISAIVHYRCPQHFSTETKVMPRASHAM